MKKYLSLFLCICILCGLSAVAFASEYTDDEWKALYGIPEPQLEDYEDSREYSAAWYAWHTGYVDFIASTQADQKEEAQPPVRIESQKSIESAGAKNGNTSQTLADDTQDKYPVGSYVDAAGVVWSPDGIRLSANAAPDTVLAADQAQSVAPPSEAAFDLAYLPAAEDSDTLAVIASMVSDIAADEPVWYLEDLRPTEAPAEILDGLKSLVTSIFGEYTPVTTTTVVTETVGNETRQYLVEAVAPGAAGVDYEWLASVFLFGILLFCLMKLLGGVLK